MVNFDNDGLPLVDRGAGKRTLVFLHYFSGAAVSWQWVVESLQTDYCCIALDLPGFGEANPLAEPSLASYSAFVKKVLDRLDVKRPVLIGHSMGAKIALQTAIDLGADGLERLILVAPSPPTQEPMPADERDRMLAEHHSPDAAATTVDGATQQPLLGSRRAIAIRTHTQAEDHSWRWWLVEGMNHSIADRLDQIQTPVTVVASKDDPVIPWDTIQSDVVNLLPGVELIQLSDVGHLIPLEVPEQLAKIIRQSIDG